MPRTPVLIAKSYPQAARAATAQAQAHAIPDTNSLMIKTSRTQREYLFNCPESFTRQSMEHRARPSEGLKSVFCLGSFGSGPISGLASLILRLARDGHERLCVLGQDGVDDFCESLSVCARWKYPEVVAVTLGRSRRAAQRRAERYEDSDVIVWPLMDGNECDSEGGKCAICDYGEERERKRKRRVSSSEEEDDDDASSSSDGNETMNGKGKSNNNSYNDDLVVEEEEKKRRNEREASSKAPPTRRRIIGYVLECLENEESNANLTNEELIERRKYESEQNVVEPVRILILNCSEEDVKRSKHSLCACLVNNDGMRKHNISGLFFLKNENGTTTTTENSNNSSSSSSSRKNIIEIERENVFYVGRAKEIDFRSSARHLSRLHCAIPSVFPIPEAFYSLRDNNNNNDKNDTASLTNTNALGLCDEVAFFSNRDDDGNGMNNNIRNSNEHMITRGEDIKDALSGLHKVPKLGLLEVFENLERFESFAVNARNARWKIFGKRASEEQEDEVDEEEEEEDEEDLLPASFGKGRMAQVFSSNSLGGPETIFLGTGCAEPSKYRAASAILVRDDVNDENNLSLPSKACILLDCGEGCLGAMKRYLGESGCSDALESLKMIWISHHHPDHCLGIVSVLNARDEVLKSKKMNSSSSSSLVVEPLLIVGPSPIEKWFEIIGVPRSKYTFIKSSNLQLRGGVGGPFHLNGGNSSTGGGSGGAVMMNNVPPPNVGNHQIPRFPDIANLVANTIGCVSICSVPVTHCPEAFAIIIRGLFTSKRSIAYSGDCVPSKDFAQTAKGVDLLIHEATFGNNLISHAKKKKHCTISEALRVGEESNAKTVCLTHFSQRYPKDIFHFTTPGESTNETTDNSLSARPAGEFACAFDGMRVKWKDWDLVKSERGMRRISEVLSLSEHTINETKTKTTLAEGNDNDNGDQMIEFDTDY